MPNVNRPSSTRQERAQLTRTRMLDAAYELFCEHGFRATTMDAIARRAGVAVQTVYFTFHTKDELVQAVHERTVLGDDGLPPPMQPWHRSALSRADIDDAVRDIVNGIALILSRVAPMVPAFHAVAADPAGDVWRNAEQLRLAGMSDLIDALTKKQKLRAGLTRRHAADVLFLLLGPDVYRTLVLERGWTPAQWAAWARRAVLAELFDVSHEARSSRQSAE